MHEALVGMDFKLVKPDFSTGKYNWLKSTLLWPSNHFFPPTQENRLRHLAVSWRRQSKRTKRTAMETGQRLCDRLRTTSARCCVARFKWRRCRQRERRVPWDSDPAFTSLKVPRKCFCRSNISARCLRRRPRPVPRWTAMSSRRCRRHRRPRSRSSRTAFKASRFPLADGSSRITATARSTARQRFRHTHHRWTLWRPARWTPASASPTGTARCRCHPPARRVELCHPICHPARPRDAAWWAAASRSDQRRARERSDACRRPAACPKRQFSLEGEINI